MAVNQYLLDTNAAIALLNGDIGLNEKLTADSDLYLPVPVAGELYFGAAKSSRIAANTTKVATFLAANVLIICDQGTAVNYGQIKAELESKGRPIPDNDMWIAAIARQHNLTLVTRDAHFLQVADISKLSW
jgi:tRNA(fMet)-specific endonuclease VapC